ncbi:DUF6881 domain-containing protein [Actinokineospora sp. NPDC004072]
MYLKVLWHHDYPDEPVATWSEIDDERWEVRKVEQYPDGSFGWVDGVEEKEGIALAEVPMPELEFINQEEGLQLSTSLKMSSAWSGKRLERDRRDERRGQKGTARHR